MSEQTNANVHGKANPRNATSSVTISVIIPCYNESENLAGLIERLESTCASAGITSEIILVNDGSKDQSWETIRTIAANSDRVVGLDLSRNFGKEIALAAGLDRARGDAVLFMDADLQHPPEAIPELIAAWRQGAEIVDAVRDERIGQGPVSRFMALLFYRLFRTLSGFSLPHDVGDFRLIDAKVAATVRKMRERQRFTKGLIAWVGYKHVRVPYRQALRGDGGRPTMRLLTRLALAIRGITSFSSYPLRIWSLVGFFFSLLGFVYIAYRVIRSLFVGIDVPGFESIIAIMLFFGGLQLISLGILGDYIGRIYDETKGRPLYIIREDTADGGEPATGPKVS